MMQRYWINSQYFDKSNGPVFLFVGGEDEANPYYVADGFMAQMANETKALAVMLEHRFYGKSQPFKLVNLFCFLILFCYINSTKSNISI